MPTRNLVKMTPGDCWILDENNKVVGVQTSQSSATPQIFPTMVTDPLTGGIAGIAGSSGQNALPFVGSLSTTNSTAAATANTAMLQAALNAGGVVQVFSPGIYYTYDSLCIGSNTKLMLGSGVRLLNIAPGGRNVLRSSNAAWSALDNHTLSNITILCACGATGVGTVNYVYTSNTGISSTTTAYGATTFASVAGTLSYQSPTDSAAGTPVALPGFPGGKLRLVSSNGVDTLWVSVGNGGKADGTLAGVAQSYMPTSNRAERVLVTSNTNAAPKSVTWTYGVVGGKSVITVYEPAHGRQPGDKIEMLKGSGLEGLFEVYNLGNAATYGNTGSGNTSSSSAWKNNNGTTFDYWTVLPNTTLNASYWSGLAASGSAFVLGMRKIFLEGAGEINFNRAGHIQIPSDNSGDTIFLNAVSEYGVNGISIPDGNAHSYFQTNCAKGVNTPGECYSPYGSHNLRGPIRDVQLYRTRGKSDDNNADCGTSDYANFVVHFGYENSSVGTLSATDCFDIRYNGNNSDQAYEVTRLYCVAGTQLIGFTGSDYFGRNDEQASQGLSMITDEICVPNITPTAAAALAGAAGASGRGGFMSSITWNNLAVKNNEYFGTPSLTLGAGVTFGVVTINGLDYTKNSTTSACIQQNGNIDHLVLIGAKRREDSRYSLQQGATSGFIGLTGNGATANRITIRDADCVFTQAASVNNSGLWQVNPTGVVTDLDIVDSTISDGNWEVGTFTVTNGGTGYTVADVLTVSSTGIGSSNATATVATVSSGVVLTVNLTGRGSFYNTSRPSNPVSTTGGTGTGCTLNINWNPIGSRKSYGVFNSGTISRVRISGCVLNNTDSVIFSNTAVASGNPTVSITNSHALVNYVVNASSAIAFAGLNVNGLTGSGLRMISANHTSGNVPLRLSNCGGWTASGTTMTTGGGLYSVYAWDFPLDVTQASFTKTLAAQYCKTAAAAGTIPSGRLAVCDGTNWRCVDDRTLLL